MKVGMVGLGRMGANMVRRLITYGHECVVFDLDKKAVQRLSQEGALPAESLPDLVQQLDAPRVVWLMLPARVLEDTVTNISRLLTRGDTLIDGGNSYFRDDIRRSAMCATRNISYLDVGTSGGIWGAERGYCLMVGGDSAAFKRAEPLFRALAPGQGALPVTPGLKTSTAHEGFLHCGPSGAGHFAKMVHNGIEYGLMQAYAEGFDLLSHADRLATESTDGFHFNLTELAELWRRGSVIGSWLLDLTAQAYAEDPKLMGYQGAVDDTGEGRWTVNAAVEAAVPLPAITAALFTRFRSRERESTAEKTLSAMRAKFGGHSEAKK